MQCLLTTISRDGHVLLREHMLWRDANEAWSWVRVVHHPCGVSLEACTSDLCPARERAAELSGIFERR